MRYVAFTFAFLIAAEIVCRPSPANRSTQVRSRNFVPLCPILGCSFTTVPHECSGTIIVDNAAITNSAPSSNPYEGHGDPPLAEAMMHLLGMGILCIGLTDDSPRLFRKVCLIAAVLTLIAYGSWWWTEFHTTSR
jgi:hypothetical protein